MIALTQRPKRAFLAWSSRLHLPRSSGPGGVAQTGRRALGAPTLGYSCGGSAGFSPASRFTRANAPIRSRHLHIEVLQNR